MNKNILLFFRYLLIALMLLSVSSGCSLKRQPEPLPEQPTGYRSELAEPAAKALFAFAQFRLLAVENRWDEAIAALKRAVEFDPRTPYLRMSLAKALLHKDQADESIQILQQVLKQDANNLEAHELLGDLYGYKKQNEQAVKHYRLALELAPDNEMLRMRLAMALGRLDRNEEAISLLENMVAKQPDAKLAQLSLARFYLENGQPEKAKATYRNLLEHHPDQQQAALEYGRLLEEQELTAEAFALYRSIVRQNPRAVLVRQQLALLYLENNRKAEALEQYLAVQQLLPGDRQILWRIGLLHLDMEVWSAAEDDFRQLLTQGEGDGRYRYYLGLALLGQQKYQQAIEVMAPIDETSPVFTEAILQLAYLYRQADQLDKAIKALEKLLVRDVQSSEVYYYLTSFYAEAENIERATQVAAVGLERYPENVALLYQAAVLFEKQGDRDKALELMNKVLRIDEHHADALNFIAYHYAEKGTQLDLALKQAQKALAAKKSGYIVDTLGWIYFKMGRYNESRDQLEEATNLLPDDPVILEHLGDLYRALTLWEQAAEAYRKSLGLDPLAEQVEKKLHELPLEGAE